MIPEWRRVNYEDDGNARFECLSCYNKFVVPDFSIGYTYDGVYTPSWSFCPFCGIKWARERTENERRNFRDSLADAAYGSWEEKDCWLIADKYTTYAVDRSKSAKEVLAMIRRHDIKAPEITIGKRGKYARTLY